jgi:hypothetical protein
VIFGQPREYKEGEMVELEQYPDQIEEGRDSTIFSSMPFGDSFLSGRYYQNADVRETGLIKSVGLLLLAILALLFTGMIGGKALKDKLQNDGLQSEINLRLLEVTR